MPTTYQDLTSPALYTLVSIDPDAPSRSNQSAGPWRHCVIDGLQPASLAEISLHATSTPAQEKALVRRTKEEVICEWTGPSPPTGTGDHRYMFLLYRETKPIVPLAEQTTVRFRFFLASTPFFKSDQFLILMTADQEQLALRSTLFQSRWLR